MKFRYHILLFIGLSYVSSFINNEKYPIFNLLFLALSFYFLYILVVGVYKSFMWLKGKNSTWLKEEASRKEAAKPRAKFPAVPGKEFDDHITGIEEDGLKLYYVYLPEFEVENLIVKSRYDEFEGTTTLTPHRTFGSPLPTIWLHSLYYTDFFIGFIGKKGKPFLSIGAYQKDIKFRKGDEFSVILLDGEKMTFSIEGNPQKIDKYDNKNVLRYLVELDDEVFKKIIEHPIRKWRYYDVKEDQAYTNDISDDKILDINAMSRMIKSCLEYEQIIPQKGT